MGEIATDYIEQIARLKNRGMEMDLSEEKVKEILLDIGYYRLGFYWNPFEVDNLHNFKENTKFSDAVALYYLDVDLRNLLARNLNRIEINFRTKLVYYASNTYKNSPTWFVDHSIMTQSYIRGLNKIYNDDFRRRYKAIRLHHQKYINHKYAPAWKSLEFFSFGSILKTYTSLKDNRVKELVAKDFDILNYKKFINLMEAIVYVRNACAHGNVLFDLHIPKGIAKLPQITFANNQRHSLFSAIKAILFILGQISENRKMELEQQIQDLFSRHASNGNLKAIIEQKIGFGRF